MPFAIEPCASWTEFKAVTLPAMYPENIATRGRYFFRGQGSDAWPLMSSFDRWYKAATKRPGTKKDAAERFMRFLETKRADLHQIRVFLATLSRCLRWRSTTGSRPDSLIGPRRHMSLLSSRSAEYHLLRILLIVLRFGV